MFFFYISAYQDSQKLYYILDGKKIIIEKGLPIYFLGKELVSRGNFENCVNIWYFAIHDASLMEKELEVGIETCL